MRERESIIDEEKRRKEPGVGCRSRRRKPDNPAASGRFDLDSAFVTSLPDLL